MGYELDLDLLNTCIHCKKCEVFPETCWSEIPEAGCEISGRIFLLREEAMQKVRRAKEELLDLMVLKSKTVDEEKLADYQSYEVRLNYIIDKFKTYGSENW